MKTEVENWFKQAEVDLKKAKILFDNVQFGGAAFYCRRCVEKALKALYTQDKKELLKTHNILRMAKLLNLPENLLPKIESLEPIYQETRYPDIAIKIPAEEFTENKVSEFLGNSKRY